MNASTASTSCRSSNLGTDSFQLAHMRSFYATKQQHVIGVAPKCAESCHKAQRQIPPDRRKNCPAAGWLSPTLCKPTATNRLDKLESTIATSSLQSLLQKRITARPRPNFTLDPGSTYGPGANLTFQQLPADCSSRLPQ